MSFDRMDLKKADYSYWNYVAFVTLNEFIYLAAGCEPLHVGTYGNGYLNLTNNDVKAFYKKVNRLGEELPATTTKETEVHDSLKPEPKYEAVYLMKWVKSKNIPVSNHYKPIMSPERIKANHLNRMLGMDIVTIDDSAAFLAAFNPHIENGEIHFKNMLLGAIQVGKITPINNSHCYDIPHEERDYKFTLSSLIMLSKGKGLNIPIELYDNNEKNNGTSELRKLFGNTEIVKDGLVDVRKIGSTKLVLAIENYVTNMFGVDSKKIISTDAVKANLIEKYGNDGVNESMARTIDECSRHDLRANNPPSSARNKTIFFQ